MDASCGKVIPFPVNRLRRHAADVRRLRFDFPELWAVFLRRVHAGPVEVAAFYAVSPKTAENWWSGACGGSGAAVALAALAFPAEFGAVFAAQVAA